MRKKLIVNNGYNDFNKAPYGEQGSCKYYIGYLGSTGFRPLHIITKKMNF